MKKTEKYHKTPENKKEITDIISENGSTHNSNAELAQTFSNEIESSVLNFNLTPTKDNQKIYNDLAKKMEQLE